MKKKTPELLVLIVLIVFPTIGKIVEYITKEPIGWWFVVIWLLVFVVALVISNRWEE
jgi:dolichyl-phosphate-mannose--protein O-mannosyl transferase